MILSRLIFIFLLYFTLLALYAFVPLSFIPPTTSHSQAASIISFHPAKKKQVSLVQIITPSISPTNISTEIPTVTFTPSQSVPKIADKPEQTQNLIQADGVSGKLLAEINNFRTSNGMNSIEPNNTTCALAQTRAQEIRTNFSHDGFHNRVNNHTLPYRSYSLVVENLALNSNVQNVVQSWINSPGHKANLLANIMYGCIGAVGMYYTFEGVQY